METTIKRFYGMGWNGGIREYHPHRVPHNPQYHMFRVKGVRRLGFPCCLPDHQLTERFMKPISRAVGMK